MQIKLISMFQFHHLVLTLHSYLYLSHIRECLKLDQDDKKCFSHYKQVKKLSKQLDNAEELIQMERSALKEWECFRICVSLKNQISSTWCF